VIDSQICNVDYEETFSPTFPIASIFIALRKAAVLNFSYDVWDISGAFLEGNAEHILDCRLQLEC
jgi:hypothetical protein